MRFMLGLFIFLATTLAACAGPGDDPSRLDTGSPAETTSGTLPADTDPQPATESALAAVDEGVVFGRLDDGPYFHGALDAPVTLIDYSDFL
jgi:hypothetical protein